MNNVTSIESQKFESTDLRISKVPFYKHEDAELILKKAKMVSLQLGIVDEVLYRDHSTMTNYLYVDASMERMVNTLVTYDAFYFLDDFFGEDTVGEETVDLKTILKLWEGENIAFHHENQKASNLYQAISYIGKVVRDDSSEAFFSKYTKSIKNHLFYVLGDIPFKTVEEYIEIRLHTSGMLPVLDLMEYANDNYVTNDLESKLPLLGSMKNRCALIGGLSNDLFSYAKEKHSSYNLINAFLLTKEANSYEEAVVKSIDIVNELHFKFEEEMLQMKRYAQQLDSTNQSIILKYLKGLEVVISACYHWQLETRRYKHPENIFEDMRK